MSQNGKGDSPRKKLISEIVWAKNWERIFRGERKKTFKKKAK